MEHLEYAPSQTKSLTAMDVSLPFVEAAKKGNIGPHCSFVVGSIADIPFKDKSFDTTIVAFVIHHVPCDPRKIFAELQRVTRKHIVVFDHLRAEKSVHQAIQTAYWNVFDGGCNYLTPTEWADVLKPFHVVKRQVTGAIFGHVVKFALELPSA